ncbi:MAG TPA: F-box protein [Candidatus Saccharimonadales bacterium]|nr:F-box protein [Candidatus Saccharimonadales bacterium]
MIFDYDDIIYEILKYLNIIDLCRMKMLNSKLYQAINNDQYYQLFINHKNNFNAGHSKSLYIHHNKILTTGHHCGTNLYKPTVLLFNNPISVHCKEYTSIVWCRDGLYYMSSQNTTQLNVYHHNILAIAISHHNVLLLKKNGLYMMDYKRLKFQYIEIFKYKNITKIACGYNHSIVIVDACLVYGFGSNTNYQLGCCNSSYITTPLDMMFDGDLKYIDACGGVGHTVVLSSLGTCFGLGSNHCGELGLGMSKNNIRHPTLLPINNVVSIACGHHFTLFLNHDNELYGCGDRYYSNYSIYNDDHIYIPTRIHFNHPIKSIACGSYNTMIKTNKDDYYVVGYNQHGALGLGKFANKKIKKFKQIYFLI